MDRRAFLKTSGAFVCGVSAAAAITPLARAEPTVQEGPNILGPRAGFSPQMGTLVSMLTWMRGPVVSAVKGLTPKQLDYLHDAKANTIGALLLHLAATERLYQIHTFEERPWGDWDEETKKRWIVPMNLDQQARKSIKGNDLVYYLETLKTVREQTLHQLQKRDDAWLMKVDPDFGWGPTNNLCKWFHVCEHESHHNGQIKWLRSRLPS